MVRKAAGKQLQTDPHAKKAQKAKQQHRPSTHTPLRVPGTPPSKPLRRRGGEEEKRGRKLSLGSWHSAWPTASFSVPACQTWPSWWVPRAGGCSIPPRPRSGSPACTCRARRQLQLDSSYMSREAERAAGAICRAAFQWTCSSGGFAKLRFKAPSFCSGLQTPFCCKTRTFSPAFLGSRSHIVICKDTLPAKCKCCPDHINNLQWWFLTVRILPLLNLLRKDEGPLSQAQKRIET